MHAGCERTLINTSQTCPPLGDKGNNHASQTTSTPDTEQGEQSSTASSLKVYNGSPDVAIKKAALAHAMDEPKASGAGFIVSLLLPIVFIMSIVVWVFYAYRNPHTKSGQLLIQVSHVYSALEGIQQLFRANKSLENLYEMYFIELVIISCS